MKKEFDLRLLKDYDSVPKTFWTTTAAGIALGLWKGSPHFELIMEGAEHLPRDEPVIVAMNHTHFFDFLPLRAPLYFDGQKFCSWVKARAYKSAASSFWLRRVGTIPLCSKGYVIVADYVACFGERPSDETYRILRDHVDAHTPLPEGEPFETIAHRRRDILGWHFDPDARSWRDAVRTVFYDMMQLSVQKTRANVAKGEHVHVYPQGSIARRLIPGKVGMIELALDLGLPILALGVSGCRESFIGKSPLVRPNSRIIVRFDSSLYAVPREEFPHDYRPFHPDDTERHRARLERHTSCVMERINALLEPDYQWATDLQSDAKTGIRRFF